MIADLQKQLPPTCVTAIFLLMCVVVFGLIILHVAVHSKDDEDWDP